LAYALFAGNDALPHHEVHGPIRQRLRLRHEPLKKSNKDQTPPKINNGKERRSRSRSWWRAHGGGSCATICAPPPVGRGRCHQMPSHPTLVALHSEILGLIARAGCQWMGLHRFGSRTLGLLAFGSNSGYSVRLTSSLIFRSL